MTTKVRVRTKPISDNRESLYLDFYPPIIHPETGKPTRRHFLGRFLYKPIETLERKSKGGVKNIHKFDRNPSEHDKKETHNSEQLVYADQVRSQWERKLNANEALSDLERRMLDKDKKEREIGDRNFVDYFQSLANKRKASNHDNWISAYHYLLTFTGGSLKFVELNETFCNDFKEYLLTTRSKRTEKLSLSQNSAVSYFNKIKASLKQAYKEGLISYDLNVRIKPIETREILKQTLTIEELNILASVPCKYPVLKSAALFSALTGLPFKEMQNLTWGHIEESESFGTRIKIIRQKTTRPYIVNISKQALELLGERNDAETKVFIGLNNKDRYNNFHIWLAEAGIKKQVTFHDLRHTYGSLQIEFGTDPYTLQGNMGHATPR